MGEPVRFEETCTIGRLHIAIPPEFKLKIFDAKKAPHTGAVWLGPEEIYACWRGPGGEKVFAHFWPQPPREPCELAAARQWECEAAGRRIRVVEMENFRELAEPVLAARFEVRRDGEYLIYAAGLTPEAFEAILKSMRLA